VVDEGGFAYLFSVLGFGECVEGLQLEGVGPVLAGMMNVGEVD